VEALLTGILAFGVVDLPADRIAHCAVDIEDAGVADEMNSLSMNT
jgi:hypothetical protein